VKKWIILLLTISTGDAVIGQTTADVDLTGLWKGTLFNDTTGLYYSYEIGISLEKNKYTGFSHTYFIKDDKSYYGVKKLSIHIDEQKKLIVVDDGMIANNYPEAPAKGVKQTNVLSLTVQDSTMILEGPYSTNNTKNYHAITGRIRLERKNDYWKSALMPHLQELGQTEKLSFVKVEAAKNFLEKKKTESRISIRKKNVDAVSSAYQTVSTDSDSSNSLNNIPQDKTLNARITSADYTSTRNKNQKIRTIEKVHITDPPAAHAFERMTILEQTIQISSDSLVISLYDNGEVDGDTVSVLMNGELLMAKQGLSTRAIRRSIFFDPNEKEIELVMYAENLGKIPPNTGLLVVQDGKNLYEIRFSGDMKTNAAIRIRRKE
jgi:hypothetical protein